MKPKQPKQRGSTQRVHSVEFSQGYQPGGLAPVQDAYDELARRWDTPILKFCVDCAHCNSIAGVQFFCEGGSVSLITGKPVTIECADMRAHNGECGPDGKLFKQAVPAMLDER